jgi:NADH/NAD ratio-sensing transcriptional regulator Rex
VKDWGYLGSSGTRGLGFPVSELLVAIREDLRRESLHQVKLAVVAVPAEHAREVATELVNAGVQGIL